MPLTSPRFVNDSQCQQASNNSPPMRRGHSGSGVMAVQQALIDLGHAMPASTTSGHVDGRFGPETFAKVRQFQHSNGLSSDGIAGRNTMARLDVLCPGPSPTPPPAPPPRGLPYIVPGFRVVIAQPTSMVCWATVHCMMRSWKRQQSLDIRGAAAQVEEKYGVMVDNNRGMPPAEFGPFIQKAGMALQPMMNLMISAWLDLLRTKGLLWIGALNAIGPGAGLHSRILEGMTGDGTPSGTRMKIIDPAGGRRYSEDFLIFQAKYEGAIIGRKSEYYQIRHFR